MSSFSFETTGDEIASLCSNTIKGKVILVDGISPGSLGAEFALTVAKHEPALIILAARDISKAEKTAATIKAVAPKQPSRLLELDLNSQAKVRKAAKEVNSYSDVDHIDVLVNSAGIMAGPYRKTAEGIELQFGGNHIGHFLFTNLIMNKLITQTGDKPCRVVNVSSIGHRLSPVRFDDWNFQNGKTYDQWLGYGQSKTANMLFSVGLTSRLGHKGLTPASLHPGEIQTNLDDGLTEADWTQLGELAARIGQPHFTSGFTFKTLQQGVATYVFAAFHESVSAQNTVNYLENSRVLDTDKVYCWARDSIEADKLWKLSEELVGEEFQY